MKEFLSKKNIINLLFLGIMVLAIPLTVKLARQQQILFSRAAQAQVEFLTKDRGGTTIPNDPNNASCVITRKINNVDQLVSLCQSLKVKVVAPTGSDIRWQNASQSQGGRSTFLQQGLVSTVYAQGCTNGCNDVGGRDNDGRDYTWCNDDGGYPMYDDDCGGGGIPNGQQGCCGSNNDCSGGQSCSVANGACQSGQSCDPNSGGSGGCQSNWVSQGREEEHNGQMCTVYHDDNACVAGGEWDWRDCHAQGCQSNWVSQGREEEHNGQMCTVYHDDNACVAGGEWNWRDCHSGSVDCNARIKADNCSNGAEQWCTPPDPSCGGIHCFSAQTGGFEGPCNGVRVSTGGCCNQANANNGNSDCNASGNTAGGQSTQGWTCTDQNNNCAGGQACKAPGTGPVSGSCVARFQKNNNDPWDQTKTINRGESIFAGALTTSVPTRYVDGATLTITGPNGSTTLRNDIAYTPPQPGTYTLTAAGGGCTNATATLTVSGNVTCFACNSSKQWTRLVNGAGQCPTADPPTCDPNSANTYSTTGCTGGGAVVGGSCGGAAQKCYVCRSVNGQNKWVYPGTNADGTGGNPNDNSCSNVACTTTGTGSCKGPADKLNSACGGAAAAKYKCSNNACVRDDTNGTYTSATCDNACSSQAGTITKFRYAEDRSVVESAQENTYQQGGTNIIDFSFADTNPGQKFIWVQFGDDNGRWTEPKNSAILFAGPDPEIRGLACNIVNQRPQANRLLYDVEFKAIGANFGASANGAALTADSTALSPASWANDQITATLANQSSDSNTVTSKTYTVVLTRADGGRNTASCTLNTTQISFGAKLFCRQNRDFDQDNVKLSIVPNTLGVGVTGGSGTDFKGGAPFRETVTITKDGKINPKSKLQFCTGNDQNCPEYKICVKAPKSVRVCSEKFRAIEGNNIVKLQLPLCDTNDDGTCNATDAGRCKADFGLDKGNKKSCQFNRDEVVNSFEWSCLIHDYNASDEPEPF